MARHTRRRRFSKWKFPPYFHTIRVKLTGSSIPFIVLFIRLDDAKRRDEESVKKAIKKRTQLPFIYYLTRGNVSERRKKGRKVEKSLKSERRDYGEGGVPSRSPKESPIRYYYFRGCRPR